MSDELRGVKVTAPKMMRSNICVSSRPEDYKEEFSCSLIGDSMKASPTSSKSSKEMTREAFLESFGLGSSEKPQEKPMVGAERDAKLMTAKKKDVLSEFKPPAKDYLPTVPTGVGETISETSKKFSHIKALSKTSKAVGGADRVLNIVNLGDSLINGSDSDVVSNGYSTMKAFLPPKAIAVLYGLEKTVEHLTDDETVVHPYITPQLGGMKADFDAPAWVHEKVRHINNTRYFHDPVLYEKMMAPPTVKDWVHPKQGSLTGR